jgi:hypothetical protein
MRTGDVKVPFDLLLHPDLTASAKLLWMLHAAQRTITTRSINPGSDSGLSRPTLRRSAPQLAAAGWSPASIPVIFGGCASLPVHLLLDTRVCAQARVLYGMLQALPKFRPQDRSGKFTYAGLRRLTGAGINTLKRALDDLTRTHWLNTDPKHRRAPIQFVLGNPLAASVDAWVDKARWRIKRSKDRGEAIMQEYLSLLIDSDAFEDNVRLGDLTNPMTGERMEFDRFYRPWVAFEFQGPQHFGETEKFSKEEVAVQMGRDLMKLGICAKKGITLVEIRREDLSLNVMRQKVGHLLPLRDLTGLEKVVAYVEAVASDHRTGEIVPSGPSRSAPGSAPGGRQTG